MSQPISCTSLNNPFNGTVNVPIDSDLSWNAVAGAMGYRLSVGTSSGNYNILDGADVGNVLSYDLINNFLYNTRIFVRVIHYNTSEEASTCIEERFITETTEEPPRYFTPNNDGINDYWVVPNVSNVIKTIYIYDRYGKLLKEIGDLQSGWDGTHNNVPLPATDYWYLIIYNTGETTQGHFALKR